MQICLITDLMNFEIFFQKRINIEFISNILLSVLKFLNRHRSVF